MVQYYTTGHVWVLARLGERGAVYGWAEKERGGVELKIAPSCMDTRSWVT